MRVCTRARYNKQEHSPTRNLQTGSHEQEPYQTVCLRRHETDGTGTISSRRLEATVIWSFVHAFVLDDVTSACPLYCWSKSASHFDTCVRPFFGYGGKHDDALYSGPD